MVFACSGSFAFGHDLDEIYLFSLPNKRFDVKLIQIMYSMTLIISYPMALLPAFKIIEKNGRLQ